MAAQKRGAAARDGEEKRRRVSEATAASDRPRRTAKAPAPESEPVATTPKPKKSRASAKLPKAENSSQATKTEASAAVPEPAKRSGDQEIYWLLKAEPDSRVQKGVDVKFSIDDLAARKEPEPWDGVRNPVAQKNMRSMKKGDLAFFYHSNCKVPGIAGLMRIVREHSVDESAFDPEHPYHDPKSSRDKPRWCVVHVEHLATFEELIPLKTLQKFRGLGEPLAGMQVLRTARLSVSKVTEGEWNFILKELAGRDPASLGS